MHHTRKAPNAGLRSGRPRGRQAEGASLAPVKRHPWLPQQKAILLWALDRLSRSSSGSTADDQPSQPGAVAALSRALWSEFPELRCHPPKSIQSLLLKLAPTILDKSFTLPTCALPDINARIDRVVAEARRTAMWPHGGESPSAGSESATDEESDDERMHSVG